MLRDMLEPATAPVDPRLGVTLAGCDLRTPVLTASGTCGYGSEYAGMLDYARLGGFTTKSVTRLERRGNAPERIVEVRSGLLNAIGLANVGLQRFLAEKVPYIAEMPTRVFVNVAGYATDDYVEVARAIDAVPAVAGIELNVSCPNVSDGLLFGTSPNRLRELVEAVRSVVRRGLLIVKLSPNVTDIAETARAAIDGGAQVLSLINTYVGMAIDARARRPRLANVTGGLSGPAIKPLALFAVHRVYREVAAAARVPIIGMGGIESTEDAIEFMLAGASAVAVGTALFVNPSLPIRIADGISRYLDEHSVARASDLVGRLELPGG